MTIRIPSPRCTNQHKIAKFICDNAPVGVMDVLRALSHQFFNNYAVAKQIDKMLHLGLLIGSIDALDVHPILRAHYADIVETQAKFVKPLATPLREPMPFKPLDMARYSRVMERLDLSRPSVGAA